MTEDQSGLLAKAKDSNRAAELLAKDGLFDFAVSRAYYAMFYAAEAMLLGEGVRLSSHAAVIAAFGQRFAKTGRFPAEFHHYLIDAQDSRTQGDYEIQPTQTAEDAELAIGRARQFIARTEALLNRP